MYLTVQLSIVRFITVGVSPWWKQCTTLVDRLCKNTQQWGWKGKAGKSNTTAFETDDVGLRKGLQLLVLALSGKVVKKLSTVSVLLEQCFIQKFFQGWPKAACKYCWILVET